MDGACYVVPDAPGLGIDVDEAELQKMPAAASAACGWIVHQLVAATRPPAAGASPLARHSPVKETGWQELISPA